jgi:hypothetical protein
MKPSAVELLLAELAGRGIQLQAHGDRLRFRPQAAMTPDLAEQLKRHKAELLAVLHAATGAAAEAKALTWRARAGGDEDLAERLAEAWEERLSIITADNVPLAEAEEIALKQLVAMLDISTSSS